MIEDRLIEVDAGSFADWDRGGFNGSYRTFTGSGGEEMRIYNVNRERVETITGANLVYYNVDRQAMVIVQVKRITEDDKLGRERGYRPIKDDNFDSDLKRLRKVDEARRRLDGDADTP